MTFDLQSDLNVRAQQGLLRSVQTAQSPQSPHMIINGESLLTFCSNDYLGMANHPKVVEAFIGAAKEFGVGSGAAHLVNGHTQYHHELEHALAEFTGREAALLFSTGYMANQGVITALLNKEDAVFEDKWNHASLLDAGLLSGARFQRYLHGDVDNLSQRLQRSEARRNLIVTDGVFSMDGDIAPLTKLSAVAHKQNAWLMVDDAHGIGVLGEQGAGCCEHLNLSQQEVAVLMGTLGKGLGTAGAFVAGSKTLINYLINYARSYIYTTAMPAAVAAATIASLRIVQQEKERRQHLQSLVKYFRKEAGLLGLNLMKSNTPIQPIIVGHADDAMKMSEQLAADHILVKAIRPPTVPKGTSRLRVTFSASHSFEDLDRLLTGLSKFTQHSIKAEL